MSVSEIASRSVERSKRGARIMLITLFVLNASIAMVMWFRLSFWAELLVTYTAQLTLLSVAMLMAYLALIIHVGVESGWRPLIESSKKLSIVLGLTLLLLAHNFVLSSISPPRATTTNDHAPLRVMTFNKLYSNRNFTQIANYISARSPDILAIEETYFGEAELLAERIGLEQWHMAECSCSAYGSDLAIFSKFPITSVGMAFEDRLGGVLRAEIEYGHDHHLSVFVVHIVPAYSAKEFALRGPFLARLAEEINKEKNQVIILGDFNSAMQKIDMRRFARSIAEQAQIVGERPWPRCSWFGLGGVMCARIDHIFVPTESAVSRTKIGPDLGSDHRPVEIDIRL